MSFELFQQGPSVYLPILLLSLVVTMVAYGLFPLIFATTRKKTISKRKYLLFCFGFNFVIALLFQIANTANSGAISFVPFFLWTKIFSSRGLVSLETHGVLEGCQYNGVSIDEQDEASEYPSPEQEESSVESDESSPEIEELVEKSEDTKTKKEKFCKHCGNVLNGKNTHCTSCGKWFFSFRKHYLLYVFLVVCIAALATTTIAYHTKYTSESNKAKNIAKKNQELLQQLEQSNKHASEEYDRGYKDGELSGYSNGYSKGKTAGYDDGYDKGQSDGYDEGYSEGKSRTVVTAPRTTYPSYSTPDEPSCAIPSCNNSPQRDSFYCHMHECMKPGCHNQRANTLCFYCINHKCAMPNCNSGQAFNSYYCNVHR